MPELSSLMENASKVIECTQIIRQSLYQMMLFFEIELEKPQHLVQSALRTRAQNRWDPVNLIAGAIADIWLKWLRY